MPYMPEIKVRQKIMVTRKGEGQWYSSIIQDIRNGLLYIEMPSHQSNVLVLYPENEVEVKLSDEGATFILDTRCLSRTNDAIPLFCLAHPENVRRVQQRQFVRCPVSIEVFYALSPDKNRRPKYKKGVSIDISGGGMKLKTDEAFKQGTVLYLKFYLDLKKGIKEISIVGKVARLWVIEVENKIIYNVGVEFTDINRTIQDYIVNYVFDRMAKQLHLL